MANVTGIVTQLQSQRDELRANLQRLNEAIRILEPLNSGVRGYRVRTFGNRRISAAGRARIAAAQRARWAKVRKVSAPRRKMSRAARNKIAAAQRARWARAKKES